MLEKNTVNEIIYYIKNGIYIKDGATLQFNLLDYYLSTQVSLEQFRKYVKKNMDSNSIAIFEKFYKLYSKRVERANEVVDNTELLSCKLRDTKIKLNISEREKVINFMQINKLPLSYYLFNQVVKRYIQGNISLNLDYINLGYPKLNCSKNITNEDVNKVMNCLKNGIIIGDKVRPFELLDYYLIVKIPLINFRKYIKNFSNYDQRRFNIFFRANESKDSSNGNLDIINLDLTIKNHRIDEAEKCQILDYMVENNIPVYMSLFLQIARRYVNGEIKLNNNCQVSSKDIKQYRKIFTRYREYDKII